MGSRDRIFMTTNPGVEPHLRRFCQDVKDAIESDDGPGWATTTTTTTTTT